MANQHQYEPKTKQAFRDFDLSTKLFISNPNTLNPLKLVSWKIDLYPQLLKLSYRRELNQVYLTKNNIKETPIKTSEFLLVFFCQCNYGITILMLSVLHGLSDKFFPVIVWFYLGYIIYFPQVFINYLQIYKYWKIDKKESFKKILLNVLQTPLHSIFGTLISLTPIKIEQLPFLKKSGDTWATHCLPSMYFVVVRQILFSWMYYNVTKVVMHGENIRADWPPALHSNMTDPDKLIMKYYLFMHYNFWIFNVVNFFTLIDQVIQYYYDGPFNKEPEIFQEDVETLLQSKGNNSVRKSKVLKSSRMKQDQSITSPPPKSKPSVFKDNNISQQHQDLPDKNQKLFGGIEQEVNAPQIDKKSYQDENNTNTNNKSSTFFQQNNSNIKLNVQSPQYASDDVCEDIYQSNEIANEDLDDNQFDISNIQINVQQSNNNNSQNKSKQNNNSMLRDISKLYKTFQNIDNESSLQNNNNRTLQNQLQQE